MDSFKGKVAVVTGGGSGMGRELIRELASEGCHVATCDVSADNVAHTVALAGGPGCVRLHRPVVGEAPTGRNRSFIRLSKLARTNRLRCRHRISIREDNASP
jgi:NAD(P)-dependent dehydrogenase (short-subunit alcohol dehydrogenase family)